MSNTPYPSVLLILALALCGGVGLLRYGQQENQRASRYLQQHLASSALPDAAFVEAFDRHRQFQRLGWGTAAISVDSLFREQVRAAFSDTLQHRLRDWIATNVLPARRSAFYGAVERTYPFLVAPDPLVEQLLEDEEQFLRDHQHATIVGVLYEEPQLAKLCECWLPILQRAESSVVHSDRYLYRQLTLCHHLMARHQETPVDSTSGRLQRLHYLRHLLHLGTAEQQSLSIPVSFSFSQVYVLDEQHDTAWVLHQSKAWEAPPWSLTLAPSEYGMSTNNAYHLFIEQQDPITDSLLRWTSLPFYYYETPSIQIQLTKSRFYTLES